MLPNVGRVLSLLIKISYIYPVLFAHLLSLVVSWL